MAQKRKKATSDDDEGEPSQSKTTQSSKKKLDKEEKEKLVGDLMRYALFMDAKKQQIKRQDILTHVTNERKEFTNEIIKEAQQKFKDIFGFEFVEVQKGNKKSTSNHYILRDCLNEISKFVEWPSSTATEMGLLMAIFGLIYVNNKSVTQELLYEQLKRLGLQQDVEHPKFGDWEKLIENTFVREGYIDRKKGEGFDRNGKPVYVYKMGPRALMEVDMKDVLKFVSEIYGEQVDKMELQELEEMQEEEDGESESQTQSSQAPVTLRRRESQRSANSNSNASEYDFDDAEPSPAPKKSNASSNPRGKRRN